MIPIKYNYRWFLSCFHCLDQITNKLIHLIDLIHIIFPFIFQRFVFDSFNLDLRILDHLCLRIVSMSLYTDSKYKIFLFCCIHGFHNMMCQNLIFCPSILCRLQDIHKLLTGKCIKSHVIKYIGTAVEISCVIM